MPKPLKLYATIKGGNLEFSSPDWVRQKMSELPDAVYTITIEKYFGQRTSAQNRYFHGAVLPLVLEGLRNAGFNEVHDTEDAKTVIKNLFLKKKITNGVETFEIVQDTHKLTTKEMADFIDEVILWAAQCLGIEIPAPNQQLTIL